MTSIRGEGYVLSRRQGEVLFHAAGSTQCGLNIVIGPCPFPWPFCFTSTLRSEWLIRGGDRGEEGERVKARPRIPPEKRPERPWTAARTMEVLRRCPLAIAQRLVHRAVAVSTAVLGQSRKDNVRCTAVEVGTDVGDGWPEAKEVHLSQPSSTSLLMISSGLTRGSSSISLLLISSETLAFPPTRWGFITRLAGC